MKKKTIIVSLIVIAISLILSIHVFATAESLEEYFDRNSGRTKTTTEETATTEEESATTEETTISEESTPAEDTAEEETEAEPRNLISEKEETDKSISENEDSLISEKEDEEETEKKSSSKKENSKKFLANYKETINEDLYGSDDKEYKLENTAVMGNAFLAASEKVTIKDSRINGDLFAASNNVELENTVVTGNIFACGQEITLDVKTTSIYGVGKTLKISEDSVIVNDVRLGGTKVTVKGEVGRDKFIEVSKEADDLVYTYKYDIKDFWINKGINIAVILVIAILVLIGSPKFTDVNNQLRLRGFFGSFFVGILYIIILSIISFLLLLTGHAAGYGFMLFGLMLVLLGLGKALFILAFAIRISGRPEKISKVKVFFMTIIIALLVSAIEMIALLGKVGVIIALVFELCITLSGFGSIFEVVFTTNRKVKKMMDKNKKAIEYKAAEKRAVKEAKEFEKEKLKPEEPIAPVVPVKTEIVQEELKEEIKAEVKEEIQELKEERDAEKKLEENTSDFSEIQTKAEEGPVEDIEDVKEEIEEVKKEPKQEKPKNNSSKKKNKK